MSFYLVSIKNMVVTNRIFRVKYHLLQMKILSAINAKQYYLIGDKNQSIYGFSGANCEKIESLLKNEEDVK